VKPPLSPWQLCEEQSASAPHAPCNFNALSVSKATKPNRSDTIPGCGAGCAGAARDGPCLGRRSDRNALGNQSTRTRGLPSPALAGFISFIRNGAAHRRRDKLHPSRALRVSATKQARDRLLTESGYRTHSGVTGVMRTGLANHTEQTIYELVSKNILVKLGLPGRYDTGQIALLTGTGVCP